MCRDIDKAVGHVLHTFVECADGPMFMHKLPEMGVLQFLDVRLHLGGDQLCWQNAPRSKKGILPYQSAHSKLVKRGIAKNAMNAALTRSCQHKMQASLLEQA